MKFKSRQCFRPLPTNPYSRPEAPYGMVRHSAPRYIGSIRPWPLIIFIKDNAAIYRVCTDKHPTVRFSY